MTYSFETFEVRIAVSRPGETRHTGIHLAGGSSEREFLHFSPALLNGIVYADAPWYATVFGGFSRQPGRIYRNDLVLEMNGQSVAGYRVPEARALLDELTEGNLGGVIFLICAAAGTVSPSLEKFLARPSQRGSPDYLLQRHIRDNIARLGRQAGIFTTRAPREGEVEGREYCFRSTDEFHDLMRKGYLLECKLTDDGM